MKNGNSKIEDKPYEEMVVSSRVSMRHFSADTDELELKWHFDHENRWVTPLKENDWKFQFDNELPIAFSTTVFIPKGVYHRIIKGTTDLLVKVIKENI